MRLSEAARSGRTVATGFDASANAFDLLRLAAAVTVLVSHSFPLSGLKREPFYTWLGGYDTGGGIGVAALFVVSGFLVMRSVERRRLDDYLLARALRIVPALVAVSLFDVFVVGLSFAPGSARDYLASGALERLWNPLVFPIDLNLPGVFQANPVHFVNGSLWTLPIEVTCYILLPVLAAAVAWRRRAALLALACLGASLAGLSLAGWSWSDPGGSLFVSVPAYSGVEMALFFAAGAAMWTWRDAVALNRGMVAAALLILFAARGSLAAGVAWHVCLPYLTIYLALSGSAGEIFRRRVGDLSYGTYLYAYPVQQSAVALLGGGKPWLVTASALPITLALAWASWRLVEAPALRLKGRLAGR